MDLGDRVGHTLVLGTTRVGKTRLDKKLPFALRGRDPHAVALVKSAKERNLYDPVADGASMRNDTSAIGSRRMTLIILCSRTTLRFFVLTSRL
jgi:hypothetical protein